MSKNSCRLAVGDRVVVYQLRFVCLSVWLSVCLSVCLFVFLSLALPLFTCISLFICLFLYTSLALFLPLWLYLCIPLSMSVCFDVRLSLALYLSACLCPSVCLCLSVCRPLSLCACFCASLFFWLCMFSCATLSIFLDGTERWRWRSQILQLFFLWELRQSSFPTVRRHPLCFKTIIFQLFQRPLLPCAFYDLLPSLFETLSFQSDPWSVRQWLNFRHALPERCTMGKAIHICHVTSIFPRFSAAANSHTMTIEYVLTCQPQPQKQRADYRCEEQGWAGRAVGLFMRRQQHSTGSARHRSVFRRRYRLPRCQWVMTPGAGAKHRNWKNAPGGTRLT